MKHDRHHLNEPRPLIVQLGKEAQRHLHPVRSLSEVRDAMGFNSTQAADCFAVATLGRLVLRMRRLLAVRQDRTMKTPRVTITMRHTGRIYLGANSEDFATLTGCIECGRMFNAHKPSFQRLDRAIKSFIAKCKREAARLKPISSTAPRGESVGTTHSDQVKGTAASCLISSPGGRVPNEARALQRTGVSSVPSCSNSGRSSC